MGRETENRKNGQDGQHFILLMEGIKLYYSCKDGRIRSFVPSAKQEEATVRRSLRACLKQKFKSSSTDLQ